MRNNIKRFLIEILLTIPCSLFAQSDNTVQYCNPRFNFCILYPKSFILQPPPQNGDGRTFVSPDKKAVIYAWGNLAIEDFSRLGQEFKIATDGIKLVYKRVTNNSFIFSGIDEQGQIVYRKTCKKKINYYGQSTFVFQSLEITYPPSQQTLYKLYCLQIAKSFD